MTEAYLDGFNIVEKKEILPRIDIIIGVSGHRSIEVEDIPFFNDRVILVSGSSRQVEFPYEFLDIYKKEAFLNNFTEDFQVLRGKTFYVVYKGQPINFIDDSAFGDVFELVLAGLLQGVRYCLEHKLKNQIYGLPERYQHEIADLYYPRKLLRFERQHIEIHKAATAFLVNYNQRKKDWKILLVDHQKIGKLLPVGGHVEKGEKPEKAVVREVLEEAGIKINLFWNQDERKWVKKPVLFSVQIEDIPPFENQPAHFHEDYMYIGHIPYRKNRIQKGQGNFFWYGINSILEKPRKYNISSEMLKILDKIRNITPPLKK
jgi:8-oxo-dGTP pyrophosphatase MutT (NUDIX family)